MITFKLDGLDKLRQALGAFQRQLPFATARALTEVAKRVQATETAALPQILDRPTPFTMRAYAVQGATKANLTAIVYARPIQAAYLAPEEFSLSQKVTGVALVRAIDAPLDALGNIPRGALARYKGRRDVFIALLTMRSGHQIYGVWQRVGPPSERARIGGRYRRAPAIAAKPQRLRLLFEFEKPVVPRVRLGFRDRAMAQVRAEIGPELSRQIANAIRTAK